PPNLHIRLDQAGAVEVENGRLVAVRTYFGDRIRCRAAVVCSGTFARGRLQLGATQWDGGRAGESNAPYLSESLIALGLPLFRLRTGTCPRVDARSVDLDEMQLEEGDRDPVPFSYLTERVDCPSLPCYATWTTDETYRIVKDNLHLAPRVPGPGAGARPPGGRTCETTPHNF
ncbi:MAG: FAD-dependent oxidoreductase, partial [Planctomycetes bacterium]|nr:FAD-dependent oxidoreductase [Planctomycetota bacterium]